MCNRLSFACFALVAIVFAARCRTEGKIPASDDDPGSIGVLEAEVTGTLSAQAPVTLNLGSGQGSARVNFQAGSAQNGTKVTARLSSGVNKRGPQPASGKVVQILPRMLTLSKPAQLQMNLPMLNQGTIYVAITASEADADWQVTNIVARGIAAITAADAGGAPPSDDPDAGTNPGAATFPFVVDIDRLAVWSIAAVPAAGGADAGTGGPEMGVSDADGGATKLDGSTDVATNRDATPPQPDTGAPTADVSGPIADGGTQPPDGPGADLDAAPPGCDPVTSTGCPGSLACQFDCAARVYICATPGPGGLHDSCASDLDCGRGLGCTLIPGIGMACSDYCRDAADCFGGTCNIPYRCSDGFQPAAMVCRAG